MAEKSIRVEPGGVSGRPGTGNADEANPIPMNKEVKPDAAKSAENERHAAAFHSD
jgi:hypothetical protein